MITQVSSSLYQQLISSAEELMNTNAAGGNLPVIRGHALRSFKEQGFPTVKMEEWKYTNLQPLLNQPYQLEDNFPSRPVDLSKGEIPNLEAYKIVLVNGSFRPDLSDDIHEPGITILPIEEAAEHPLFSEHFNQYVDTATNALVALNTATFRNGLFLHIEAQTVLSKHLQLIHINSSREALFTQSRNLIIVAKHAEVKIVESFITEHLSANTLSNNVSEILLEENAVLQHYYLQIADEQSKYLNYTEIYQRKNSLYNNYNCSFPGAGFIRNNINVRLNDRAVESHLYGITLTANDQFVDNHTVVDHRKPNCESYEWYKNITQHKSTAVFNGKIFVQLDAQKTNAFQQNNNMLIGEDSTIYAKPQLEIFADDVKCSHGCTIGQFDDDALFYLRARGISEENGRVLLVHAFAFDVTEKFDNEEIRSYVDKRIEEGLQLV